MAGGRPAGLRTGERGITRWIMRPDPRAPRAIALAATRPAIAPAAWLALLAALVSAMALLAAR